MKLFKVSFHAAILLFAFVIQAKGISQEPLIDGQGIVTTRHQINLAGKTLSYTARTGLLPIRVNDTGTPHGHIFFTAYTVERGAEEPQRPLAFLWNGGPGSNSVLVHLEAFGPKRFSPEGAAGKTTIPLETNQTTWLDEMDLVFVDPVGTGYSRPTRIVYGPEFFSTLGDIASISEFIRVYLTRFDAWDVPLIIGGESYGAWRAGGVTEALERAGTKVSGVILISGGIPMGPVVSDAMRAALFIPTRTAAAFYHQRLEPSLQTDLQEALGAAEDWAQTQYGPALADPSIRSAEINAAIVGQLSRFTGLKANLIDDQTLVVRRRQFAEQLLQDKGSILGRFDTRQKSPATGESDSHNDGVRARTVVRYLRQELGFKTDLAYQGMETGYIPVTPERPAPRWDYNHSRAVAAMSGASKESPLRRLVYDGPPGGSDPWLQNALEINPNLKVFVAAGLYDSLNSCPFNEYLVSQLEAAIAANFMTRCYVGGHMMYEDEETRAPLKRDLVEFIRKIVSVR